MLDWLWRTSASLSKDAICTLGQYCCDRSREPPLPNVLSQYCYGWETSIDLTSWLSWGSSRSLFLIVWLHVGGLLNVWCPDGITLVTVVLFGRKCLFRLKMYPKRCHVLSNNWVSKRLSWNYWLGHFFTHSHWIFDVWNLLSLFTVKTPRASAVRLS